MAVETESSDFTRKLVVERLVGATGDPRKVVETARATALRALPILTEALASTFPISPTVDFIGADIVRLAELKPDPDSFDVLVTVPASLSRDALTMRLDPAALSLLVDAFFGGDPEIPAPPLERPASPVERDVAAIAFDHFASALNGSGSRALGLRLPPPKPMAGPADLKRLTVRDGPGVRMTFSLACGQKNGSLTAWTPQRVLLATRGGISDGASAQNEAEWKQRFGGEVLRAKVMLSATVPLGKIPLGALANLREGQVLKLPDTARSEARLSVRNRTLFTGELGKLGQNYTVRIAKPFDVRQDLIDGLLDEQRLDDSTTGEVDEQDKSG